MTGHELSKRLRRRAMKVTTNWTDVVWWAFLACGIGLGCAGFGLVLWKVVTR
jgi:hypothetical protein